MPDEHPLADRGRSLEEEYFRKRDRELIEKMRQASADEAARRELGEKSGLKDPEMLRELQALGFTPDTVALLPLVPLVQVAWAEGGVSDAERKLILQLARARGIDAGGAADQQLAAWLSSRPDPQVFSSASRLIRATLNSSAAPGAAPLTADDVVKYCEQIAAASGGIFGIKRVSPEERALLTSIARDLGRNP
jgi:ADP-ribose pyrophosphatase YjhB (NUDIX family)